MPGPDGGDSFLELKNGTNRTGGGVDLDEFVAYLAANSPVTGPEPAGVRGLDEDGLRCSLCTKGELQ